MKKKLTTVLAIVLVVALSVAGTYAYLTAQTDTVTMNCPSKNGQ